MKCCWKQRPKRNRRQIMSLQTNNPNLAPNLAIVEPHVVPTAVLDNLATRFRPGGLFLMLLRPDGTVAYHDPSAGLFFHRYVLPLMQYGDQNEANLQDKVQKLTPNSTVSIWNGLPG